MSKEEGIGIKRTMLDRIGRKFMRLSRSIIHPYIVTAYITKTGAQKKEDYGSYDRAYQKVSWVYTCILAVASAAASVPLKFFRIPPGYGEEEKQPVPYDHPLPSLFRNINCRDTYVDWSEALYSNQLLNGNFYNLQDPIGVPNPTAMWWLSPRRVVIVPRQTVIAEKVVASYDFYSDDGRILHIPPEEILHFKLFNPYDDWYGQGAITAARNAILFDSYAVEYNKALVKNMGRPDVLLQTDQDLDEDEIEYLYKKWEERHGGPEKAGLLGILHSGLKAQDMGLSPKDLQWLLGRKLAREEILAPFQIPPVMAGLLEDVNFATAAVQKRIFWENAVIPKQVKVVATLNKWIQKKWGPEYVAAYDYTDIAALQEDQLTKARVWKERIWAGFATPNEARREHRWEPRANLDSIYVANNLMPIIGSEKVIAPRGKKGKAEQARIIEDAKRTERWLQFASEIAPWERRMGSTLRAFLDEQEARVLTRVRSRAGTPRDWAELVEHAIDNEDEIELARLMEEPIVSDTVDWRGKKAMEALGLSMAFLLTHPDVARWIKLKAYKFAHEFTETTADRVKSALLSDPALLTLGVGAVVDIIQEAFAGRKDGIGTAAGTEIVASANAGQYMAWEQSGVVKGRTWLTARDDKVRDLHFEMDGEFAAIDEPFKNGLMFPGDPSGPPEEIVNCRCTEEPEVEAAAKLAVQIRSIERWALPGRVKGRESNATKN
jgi:HK97 family phage portal protein